jgi:predicted dinucleotide-binding enzyme
MRVTVIGAGNIGGALATAFAAAGHIVAVGVRDPAGADGLRSDGQSVRTSAIADALADADVVVLALPGKAVADLAREHAEVLAGKLVIDATNNLGGGAVNGHDALTDAVSGVRYARAFNTLGFENLREPKFGRERADMFFAAGENDRDTVAELIEAVGLRPVWVGADAHAIVDGVLPLWFALSRSHGRHLAFRVLTDSGTV